jgi:hypothetical protein
MNIEFRNYGSKQWHVNSFDFLPYFRITKGSKVTEVEFGWLCFCITFIFLKPS